MVEADVCGVNGPVVIELCPGLSVVEEVWQVAGCCSVVATGFLLELHQC